MVEFSYIACKKREKTHRGRLCKGFITFAFYFGSKHLKDIEEQEQIFIYQWKMDVPIIIRTENIFIFKFTWIFSITLSDKRVPYIRVSVCAFVSICPFFFLSISYHLDTRFGKTCLTSAVEKVNINHEHPAGTSCEWTYQWQKKGERLASEMIHTHIYRCIKSLNGAKIQMKSTNW